ncbi:MAG: hypothetical protein ACI9K3_001582 [Halovenus sp.]|jgi:hypothetical protein
MSAPNFASSGLWSAFLTRPSVQRSVEWRRRIGPATRFFSTRRVWLFCRGRGSRHRNLDGLCERLCTVEHDVTDYRHQQVPGQVVADPENDTEREEHPEHERLTTCPHGHTRVDGHEQ